MYSTVNEQAGSTGVRKEPYSGEVQQPERTTPALCDRGQAEQPAEAATDLGHADVLRSRLTDRGLLDQVTDKCNVKTDPIKITVRISHGDIHIEIHDACIGCLINFEGSY